MKLRILDRQTGRASVWLLFILMIMVGLAGYWYYQPQDMPGWVREQLAKATHTTTPLYRWKDDHGQWQITDIPPQGRSYETLTYRHDANVIPSQETGKH